MPDLSTQLRDYFDAVVERTTAEDVLARSAFDREPGKGAPRRWIGRRPALQAALAAGVGFGLTMLVAGGLLVIALLAGELASEDAVHEVGSGVAAPAGGGVGSGWILAAALMITGAVTAGALALRRRTSHTPIAEEIDMKTIETDTGTKELDGRVQTLERRNRWLVAAVAVLLVAAAALGGVLLLSGDDAGEAFAPGVDAEVVDEINALLDTNLQAWSDGDGVALLATMTEDGFHLSGGTGGKPYSGELLRAFSSSFAWLTWGRLGEPIIFEHDSEYYVAQLEEMYADSDEPGDDLYLMTAHIVSVDGELKIDHYVAYDSIDWNRYWPSSS